MANTTDNNNVPKKLPKQPVKLYLVRISPTCRVVWLYLLQNNIPHALIDVDFTSGEERTPDFISKNPHQEVPILVDGDIVVFEAQAILRYLSTQYTEHAGYGRTLGTRMLCESIISWANSELHRVVGYRYSYPHFLQRYRLPSDTANEALIESGIQQLSKHLEIIEARYLQKANFLCGDDITIADCFVATVLRQAEWVGFSFRMWPKVIEWLERIQEQSFWKEVHAAHDQFIKDIRSVID